MNLLGEKEIRYIRDHEPGYVKNSFFIPDYSERRFKGFGGKLVLIETDEYYVPPKKPSKDK